MPILGHHLLVTACALSHTTEWAARLHGVGPFLPGLFIDRFANLGGIDKQVFSRQLEACRSFRDEAWAGYWREIADEHLETAGFALGRLHGPTVSALFADDLEVLANGLAPLLAPAVEVFAERTPENAAGLVSAVAARQPDHADAAVVVDALVTAMTYLFVASWPGRTPARMQAYWDSRRVFSVLLHALAPAMGVEVKEVRIEVGGEIVTAFGVFPRGKTPVPAVLVTNGLEGTIQEVLAPALRFRGRGLAMLVMEMPGTYAYRTPLSAESERIYRAMIDHLASDPRVDADRVGMFGFSFGAHWAARMALCDDRLKAVVANGGLYHRGFQVQRVLGMPEIMLSALSATFGARNLLDLGAKVRGLSIKNDYGRIDIPLLVINGDTDTLASTQDSVDLAEAAPYGELLLYPDDDHCAMGHYTEAMDDAMDWLVNKL